MNQGLNHVIHPTPPKKNPWSTPVLVSERKDTWQALLPEIWGIGVLHFHWRMTCDNEHFALKKEDKENNTKFMDIYLKKADLKFPFIE